MLICGLFMVGAKCNMKKRKSYFPYWELNPVPWTQSPALYQVAIKAGLYHKAVQMCYTPVRGDILPLQTEIGL